MLFFETSAKDEGDEGVKRLYEDLVFWVNVKMEREGHGVDRPDNNDTVKLNMPKGGDGCCGS